MPPSKGQTPVTDTSGTQKEEIVDSGKGGVQKTIQGVLKDAVANQNALVQILD